MNYLICKWISNENNAAVKAPEDVNKIFLRMGGKVCYLWKHNIKYVRNIEEICAMRYLKCKCTAQDNIIIQWPLYCIKPLTDESFFEIPHKKMIALIHDIESYRYNSTDKKKIAEEIRVLNMFDVIIVHNRKMKEFMHMWGVKSRIVVLEIFDYMITSDLIEQKVIDNKFTISYCGNLLRSLFLKNWPTNIKHKLLLYGPISKDIIVSGNYEYRGIYNNQDKNSKIEGNFGLIWEGDSIDDCLGNFGTYMKINNALRFSMYFANGMPVIIWKKAAMAEFVMDNGVGIVVDSIREIDKILNNLSIEEYYQMVKKVKVIADRIRNGFYTEKALKDALEL